MGEYFTGEWIEKRNLIADQNLNLSSFPNQANPHIGKLLKFFFCHNANFSSSFSADYFPPWAALAVVDGGEHADVEEEEQGEGDCAEQDESATRYDGLQSQAIVH